MPCTCPRRIPLPHSLALTLRLALAARRLVFVAPLTACALVAAPAAAREVPFAVPVPVAGSTLTSDLVAAPDLDGDGDLDVAAVRENADEDIDVDWFENDGAPGQGAWTRRNAWWSSAGLGTEHRVRGLIAGDIDAAVAQGTDDQIAWYENQGGQFRVVETAIAADRLTNETIQGIFRAVVAHRGRSGDGWIELAAVAVQLEESAGDPLNAFEAASLIDAVQIHSDDGDSVFEPAADPLVASASVAGIDGYGVVWIDLVDYDLGAAIPPVAERTFFVALDLADPFLAAAPETLRVTLLTDGASVWEADDREYQLPLDLQWRENLSTATLAVLDALFQDGFESGDTTARSSTVP